MDGWADRLPAELLNVGTTDTERDRAFDVVLKESSTLIFRVAYSVLRHQEDAEDVAQEAFVRAHQRFGQIRDRGRLRSWLVRLTWRLAIDRQRSDRRRALRETAHLREQPTTSAPADVLAAERARQLWQAIDSLPEKLRVVVVLANMDGHDLNDVAKLLSLPVGTVKSRMFQARALLREALSHGASAPGSR
jgi:RNA polymerase sigma-70 factor, ECF subfamily